MQSECGRAVAKPLWNFFLFLYFRYVTFIYTFSKFELEQLLNQSPGHLHICMIISRISHLFGICVFLQRMHAAEAWWEVRFSLKPLSA